MARRWRCARQLLGAEALLALAALVETLGSHAASAVAAGYRGRGDVWVATLSASLAAGGSYLEALLVYASLAAAMGARPLAGAACAAGSPVFAAGVLMLAVSLLLPLLGGLLGAGGAAAGLGYGLAALSALAAYVVVLLAGLLVSRSPGLGALWVASLAAAAALERRVAGPSHGGALLALAAAAALPFFTWAACRRGVGYRGAPCRAPPRSRGGTG